MYDAYKFDEPWNGPNNRKLASSDAGTRFRCPAADGEECETSYVAVVGPETLWPGSQEISIRYVRDGTSKTIALVEVANSGIHWMEPHDLTIDQALRGINPTTTGPSISSNHSGGAHVIWGDAHVSFVPTGYPTDKLRALLTRDGGEDVADPDQWP